MFFFQYLGQNNRKSIFNDCRICYNLIVRIEIMFGGSIASPALGQLCYANLEQRSGVRSEERRVGKEC